MESHMMETGIAVLLGMYQDDERLIYKPMYWSSAPRYSYLTRRRRENFHEVGTWFGMHDKLSVEKSYRPGLYKRACPLHVDSSMLSYLHTGAGCRQGSSAFSRSMNTTSPSSLQLIDHAFNVHLLGTRRLCPQVLKCGFVFRL